MARVDCDVLIMGNGIVGNLAAAWFRRHMPALQIDVVGPATPTLPIVGESLVEFSTQLLQEIGLGRHLVEEQLPKYGLTFYYKLDPTAPADPRYVVDAVPTNPPLPSFLVNRFTLDDALRQLNRDNGVEHVDGKVVRAELGSGARHRVTVRDADGRERTHTARWVMDATGRRRLLARQLHLGDGVTHQRSSFWFRLADFDASILDRIDAVTSDTRRPDAYYAAHHFFGHGNWIWLIPVRAETGRQMMSVGLTCRPDLFPEPVTSIPEFLDRVADEHPILGDLVRSGWIVDTNLYRNYMYRARRRYSSQGWFLVGDAADTVDPLYSTGLALAAMAIQQVGAMIRRDLATDHGDGAAHNVASISAATPARSDSLMTLSPALRLCIFDCVDRRANTSDVRPCSRQARTPFQSPQLPRSGPRSASGAASRRTSSLGRIRRHAPSSRPVGRPLHRSVATRHPRGPFRPAASRLQRRAPRQSARR